MSSPRTAEKLRIVVAGYIVRGPVGGMTWHYLNYVLGLARMGHDVLFLEDSDDYPSCYDPRRHTVDTEPSYGLAYIADTFESVGLQDAWTFYDAHRHAWHGRSGAVEFVESADLLLNVSGVNPVREWSLKPPVRVFVDTDPLFTQVRHLKDPAARGRAETHTHFLTFAMNVLGADCSIPNDGLPWMPTRQPIVLDAWPATPPPRNAPFTTVMQWDSYASVQHQATLYGMKSASFEPYWDLPYRSCVPLEIALGTPDAPRKALTDRGWRLRNPLEISESPSHYAEYIRTSAGEFSVAKHGYVAARTGWFSERSVCYLASGRPVILQDTGFSASLPTGTGLFAFNSPDEALAGLEQCNNRPQQEAAAARELADVYFRSDRVLSELLDCVSRKGAQANALSS